MQLLDKFRNLNMQVTVSMASMDRLIYQIPGSQLILLVLLDIVILIRPDKVDIQQTQRTHIQENQECPEASLRVRVQRVEEEKVPAMRDRRIDSNIK